MLPKPELIIVVGPTASGKSKFSIKLAKKLKGEIISADSRQIYRGLDIGTDKVPGRWTRDEKLTPARKFFTYRGIRHHGIDFVSPRRTFTVMEYKKYAQAAIQDIIARGKIPIIVGGTGFWIDALVYDLNIPAIPPNPKLRLELERKSTTKLLQILRRLDPNRAKTIEPQNKRRLIRAIEIAKVLGEVPKLQKKKSSYRTLWLGLNPPYETWLLKVRKRARTMIKKGLVLETKKLLRKGIPSKRIREFGFEYRAALDYLAKKISKQELYERIVQDTLKYARRQKRWWKRNQEIHWLTTYQ